MSDKLIIEIDGNATGLTNELKKADARLNTFNRKVSESNKALTGFQTKLGSSANAIARLTATTNALDTSLKVINRNFGSLATSLGRLNKASASSAASVSALGKTANSASGSLSKLGASGSAVNSLMTSMGRRMNALNATISALNGGLRGLTNNVKNNAAGTSRNITITNTYNNAVRGLGVSARSTASGINRLSTANLGLAESFRRNVAQITALRTLTYQALFWFSPLFYSIVKVNAEYEKQMVLLKNISNASSETGKKQEASQSMEYLRNMASNAPFALETLTNAFVKLKVGGIEPTNGSLQTLVDSVAAFGGDSMNLERAAVAIQQMGGKGTVSMEELRQQLGEHVPTALKAMAEGLGYSEDKLKSFYKQVELGNVSAKEGLTAMFKVLQRDNAGKAEEMMNTWAGVTARLKTAWSKVLTSITEDNGTNSFFEKLKANVIQLTDFLNSKEGSAFLKQVQDGLAAALDAFTKVIRVAYEYRYQLIALAKLAGTLMAFRIVVSIFGSFLHTVSMITGAIGAARTALNAFNFVASASGGIMNVFTARGLVLARSTGLVSSSVLGLIPALTSMMFILGPLGIAVGVLAGAYWFMSKQGEAARAKQAEINENARLGEPILQRLRKAAEDVGGASTGMAGGLALGINKMVEMSGAAANLITQLYGVEAAAFAAARATAQQQMTERRAKVDSGLSKYESIQQSDNKFFYFNELNGKALTKEEALKYQASKVNRDVRSYQSSVQDDVNLDNDFKNRIDNYGKDKPKTDDIPSSPASGDDKKKDKKGPKGPKTDPLDRFRNKFQNEYVQSQSLLNDYQNLRDNTDITFDSEKAEDIARATAARIKDKEVLEGLIRTEQDYQKELKKTIAIQEAIFKLKDDSNAQNAETANGFNDLERGYSSIQEASSAYRTELERQYKQEITTLAARIASGKATADQIRQYRELTQAINDNVRAKEAADLLQLAQEADGKNQAYDDSYLTNRAIANREGNIEISSYTDALQTARTRVDSLPQQLRDAANQLKEAEEALADASSDLTQEQKDNLEEIIVTAKKAETQYIAEADQAKRAIPYLERRIEILKEEQRIRDKWDGMGGPLVDWARDAAKGMDDLGASMGDLLVNQFDSLIDSFAQGKLAFGDFVKSMITGLIKIIIRALIAKAILSALGLGSTGSSESAPNYQGVTGSGADSGFFQTNHTGGIAGTFGGAGKSADPAMFNFAQRYHTGGIVGLGSSEVPIIAEKGEGVFTKEQMKAMGGSQKGSNVEVNVINQTGTQAEVERKPARFDGEKWVEDIILKKMSQPGPVRTMLNAKRS